MLVAHLANVLCCYSINVTKACVFKQTRDTGLLGGYWDNRFAYNKLIITLGIQDTATGDWLDGSSGPTSGGADVYNFRSGTGGDNTMAVPVRYDLLHQGDAVILRRSRYKSTTVAPPVGFDVYKFIIWFNTKSLTF